jgi:hypothetical protein
MTTEQVESRWCIDFDWYERSNRSLLTLVMNCLCPVCRERLEANRKPASVTNLLSNIKDCCSQTPKFINSRSPVLEAVFRLFLTNSNQPLDLEELGKELRARLEGDTYRTSPQTLSRLLSRDQYYGLRQVQD